MIDLFAGVGGLSLGFEKAGFEVVVANEYDATIAEAYIKNRNKPNMIIEDITKLSITETFGKYKGQVKLVVGGPPCQGYSQKGQRKTINDPRNFLFKYFIDVVREVRPEYFVMENVPNLLTAEKGYFKQELEKMFKELGYTINAQVLNAADFGVPQNRHRAFIIGKKGDKPVLMPEKHEKRTTIWEAISDLAYLNSGEGDEISDYKTLPLSEYQCLMRQNSVKVFNHVATNHSKIALERLDMIPPKGGKEYLPPEHLTKSIYSGTWERMDADDISVTITTRFDTPSSGKFTHPYLNRAITVREAARIQSFPDDFHFFGTKTSQMKQVGNAVPPMLANAVANAIIKDINNSKTDKRRSDMPYQVYNPGINTGSSFLTEKVAFFLGGIYAANECVKSDNGLYWAAPVRYNPSYSTTTETAEHFDYIATLSSSVNGYTVMKENILHTSLDSGKNRLPGFSTFFQSTGLTDLSTEIPNLKAALFASSKDVQKAFIIGAIDGRGTPDASETKKVIRYLSLDCPTNDIGMFLSDVMLNFGIDINYNTARDRLEGGEPRKPQLRIKDVEWYMANMGYISPAKIKKLKSVYLSKYGSAHIINAGSFLTGLKCLTI